MSNFVKFNKACPFDLFDCWFNAVKSGRKSHIKRKNGKPEVGVPFFLRVMSLCMCSFNVFCLCSVFAFGLCVLSLRNEWFFFPITVAACYV